MTTQSTAYSLKQAFRDVKGKWTSTTTFSKSTESNAGMTIHGKKGRKGDGYNRQDLEIGIDWAKKNNVHYERYDLGKLSGTGREAYVLVLKSALSKIEDEGTSHCTMSYLQEFVKTMWPNLDRKFINFMKVTTKKARGNAEIGPVAIESSLKDLVVGARIKKGTALTGVVFPYSKCTAAKRIADALPHILGKKASNLLAEVNFYGPASGSEEVYKMEECGIGFHGDGERPDVVGVVLGETKELQFQGFKGTEPVGKRITVAVGNGDLYVMCEVACGFNWVQERNQKWVKDREAKGEPSNHYRHAAGPVGGNKYTPSNETLKKRVSSKRKRKADSRNVIGRQILE